MDINIIVAVSENMAIGKNNQMLWHLPEDFRYFKNVTWGLPILMGRRTFNSMDNKPLPGRINLVLSRNKEYKAAGVIVVNKIDTAIFMAKEHHYNQLFVIGGGQLYKDILPKVKKIYITRIKTTFEAADTFFPAFSEKEFQLISSQEHKADEKHQYDYTFEVWERKR